MVCVPPPLFFNGKVGLTVVKKRPVVDMGACTLCESCVAVCPSVFSINDAGIVEVADLALYPEADVEEAIKYCPEDCIFWETE